MMFWGNDLRGGLLERVLAHRASIQNLDTKGSLLSNSHTKLDGAHGAAVLFARLHLKRDAGEPCAQFTVTLNIW